MSLKHEQHRSLLLTREFLFDLLFTDTRPKTVGEIKKRANQCLKHFPPLREDGEPMFSKDGQTDK